MIVQLHSRTIVFLAFILISISCKTMTDDASRFDYERLRQKSTEALVYCKQHNLETSYCVLIDMSIHSGKNRFFIWDFNGDSIMDQGLVSHGCGSHSWGADETKTSPLFSNTPESHLSSVGRYRIGKRGYSQWGIHVNYKLHGLDKTNKNAYSRYIVLHSWNMMPSYESYPSGSPEGWGCPAVSNSFMQRIDKRLKNKKTDVLLWIFD